MDRSIERNELLRARAHLSYDLMHGRAVERNLAEMIALGRAPEGSDLKLVNLTAKLDAYCARIEQLDLRLADLF